MTQPSSLVPKAAEYARRAHESIGFVTACGYDRPQTEHLQEVADLVWAAGGSEEQIAAAWLHDSVEDTWVTVADIRDTFGEVVADLVEALTDPEGIHHLPTQERKAKQAEHIRGKSNAAKLIKLADQTSNVRCVTVDPKESWSVENRRTYALGTKKIVDECKGVNHILEAIYEREYERAREVLGIDEASESHRDTKTDI